MVTLSDLKPPTLFFEAWAGEAAFLLECVRVGFVGRAFECKPQNGTYLPEGGILRPDNIAEIETKA